MRKKPSEVPASVAEDVVDTLLDSQQKLKAAFQAQTEAAVAQVKAEQERTNELRELRGDIQSVMTWIGELVSKMDTAIESIEAGDKKTIERVASLEDFQRGFSIYIGGELRDLLQHLSNVVLQISEQFEYTFRGWTAAAMIAEAQGVDVPKPPGYELGDVDGQQIANYDHLGAGDSVGSQPDSE